jgi:hypothetical protein
VIGGTNLTGWQPVVLKDDKLKFVGQRRTSEDIIEGS